MPEIQMPKLSDTMTEGTLVAWKKKKGDKVSAGDVIAEIETDKATMEWESPEDGTLTEIYVEEGGKVNVGDNGSPSSARKAKKRPRKRKRSLRKKKKKKSRQRNPKNQKRNKRKRKSLHRLKQKRTETAPPQRKKPSKRACRPHQSLARRKPSQSSRHGRRYKNRKRG